MPLLAPTVVLLPVLVQLHTVAAVLLMVAKVLLLEVRMEEEVAKVLVLLMEAKVLLLVMAKVLLLVLHTVAVAVGGEQRATMATRCRSRRALSIAMCVGTSLAR